MRILADLTAYRYMRHKVLRNRWLDWKRAPREGDQDAVLRAARPDGFEELRSAYRGSALGARLEYLVPSAGVRKCSNLVHCNVWGGRLPEGSLIGIDQGEGVPCETWVCSPEFLGLRYAMGHSYTELLLVIQLLFGSHVLVRTKRGTEPCVPMSSRERLEVYLTDAGGLRGVERARKAARYALQGAASPAESMLGALFSLPSRQGGLGLSSLELNREVDTPLGAEQPYGTPKRKCDLYVPEIQLDIEYDSDVDHKDERKRRSDAVRRNQLEMVGVPVMTITSPQLYSYDALLTIAQGVYGLMGKRWRMSRTAYNRGMRLHGELLAALDGMKVFM